MNKLAELLADAEKLILELREYMWDNPNGDDAGRVVLEDDVEDWIRNYENTEVE